jgi:hypothetical protein
MQHLSFTYTARSPAALVTVIAIWAALFAAWIWLDAAPWVLAIFGAFTLPAVFDLAANPSAGAELTDDTLSWHAGRATAEVALDRIQMVRLDTRLDFSVRATLVLTSGHKIKMPFQSTPPHVAFEQALIAAGLKVERHHFSLWQ